MKCINILFGVSLILLITSCSSEPESLSALQNRNGLYYQINTEEPYSGKITETNEDGTKVLMEGKIENGLKQDNWITYYENGQQKSNGDYIDGLKDGEWNYWEENGEQKAKELYKEGKLLDNSGTISSDNSSPADDSDPMDDEVNNGAEPIRFGLLKAKLKDGAIRKLYNGEPYTGPVIDYHDNGTIKLKGYFKDGLRTGKWTYYSNSGTLIDTKQF